MDFEEEPRLWPWRPRRFFLAFLRNCWYNDLKEKRGEADMKKRMAFALILMALLCGCVRESAYRPDGAANVTMTLSHVTPAGATVVIQDDNREPFVYGEWFAIEREKDGVWYEVRTKISNYGFNEIGWLTDDRGGLTMTVDWEWLYGELPAGHYRILKQAGTQVIAAEFTVE